MPIRRAVKVLRPFASLFYNISRVANLVERAHRVRNARYVIRAVTMRRAICFILCLGLILSSWPIVQRGLGKSAEKSRVKLTQGPPGLNLPDLNEARRMNTGVPKISLPVSAASASTVEPSATAPPLMQLDNWAMDLIKPSNRVGTSSEDLLSRNFNWATPIVSIPGRAGMDLNLGLSLNSLVWTKSGTNIYFNLAQGFPSPGFRLGLPELGPLFYNTETATESRIVIMPSGRMYEFRLNPAYSPEVVYEEMGSTYMLLTLKTNPFNSLDKTWTLLPPDGSAYKFRIIANNPKCVEAKDRNGNFISVSYNGLEQISNMIDTTGRGVTFTYDGSNRLTSITQNWSSGAHTYATFAYENVTIQTFFPGLNMIGAANGTVIPALSRVTMADGKVYAFEYNSYAQVKTVRCYAPNSANPGDFPDDYTLLSSISYNLTPGAGEPQSDCPRFSSREDWAKDWNDGVTTTYAGDGATWGEVTPPDGTRYKEFFGPSGWQRGLTLETETWSNGSRKKWTASTWVNGNPNVSYWLNPRVVEINVNDQEGNHKKNTMDYTDFGAVSDIREYEGSTVLRHTQFGYLRGPAYTGNLKRRLTRLVTSQKVYDGSGALQSKVTSEYDLGGQSLVHPNPAPVRHDATNFGPAFVQGRGNLNVVRRWNVNYEDDATKSVATTTGHNTSGGVIFSRDPLNHETKLSYVDSFSDSVNRNTYAYPTTMTDADTYSSTVKYNFDTGAVTRTQDPKGAVVVTMFDEIGRVERVKSEVNQGYTRYVYAPNHLYVESYTTVNDLSSEFYRITVFDGHFRVRGLASEHPGSAGGYKAQNFEYDDMGRLSRQSNPTEVNGDWETAGDDEAGRAWGSQTYDWQWRPTFSTNQDGSTRSISYEGCGCAGGQKVVVTDEMGRRREQSFDILGRMWRERTYNWGGSGETGIYTTTTNTYNVRDQVTNINVLDNASGASQNTVMTYDGHGRMKEKWLPIFLGNPQSATPYISYEYYGDGTLKKVTDPRGASSTQTYNNRHLLTGVTYGAPSGVAAAANVSFAYDGAGNRTTMDDGPGMVTYAYDTLSRMTGETRVFDNASRYHYQGSGQPYQNTFTIGYQYNLDGGLKQIQTPTGDTVDYTLDEAGMVTRVWGTPRDGVTDYITDIKYRAWGAAKRVSYGYANYSIEAQFNGRMLITGIDDQSQFGVAYNYNADGRVNTVQGIHTRTLDRSFGYDHLGRVNQTRSGSAAGLGSADPEQLKQDYVHDAFNHMTSRSGRYWYAEESAFTATYVNDRGMNVTDAGDAQNWEYDVVGNVKSFRNEAWIERHDRNAANRMVMKSWHYTDTGELAIFRDYAYDGDGNLVSDGETGTLDGSIAKYYVRSTILSKPLLSVSISWFRNGDQYYIGREQLLNGQLRDLTGRSLAVYVGGEEIATRTYDAISLQDSNKVVWQHRDPHGAIAEIGNASSSTVYSVDPLGVLVKTVTQSEYDAYWAPPSGGDPNPPQGFYSDQSGSGSSYGYSNPFAGNWGLGCYVDGVQTSCENAFRASNNGSGYISNFNITGGMGWQGTAIAATLLNARILVHEKVTPANPMEEIEEKREKVSEWSVGGEAFGIFAGSILLGTGQSEKGLDRQSGIKAARTALKRDTCKNYIKGQFGEDPLALFNTLVEKGQFNPGDPDSADFQKTIDPITGREGHSGANTRGTGVNARIITDPGVNRRNAEGRRNFRAGLYDVGGKGHHFAREYNISNAEGVALVFLHELSHATGKNYHAENEGKVNYKAEVISQDKLNKDIYDNCFKPLPNKR